MHKKGRVLIPSNSVNLQFITVFAENPSSIDGNVSFRMNVSNRDEFHNLQYKLGDEDWKGFIPRDISANLYIVRLKPFRRGKISLRISSGQRAQSIIIPSIDMQESGNVGMFIMEPVPIQLTFDMIIKKQLSITPSIDIIPMMKNLSITLSMDMMVQRMFLMRTDMILESAMPSGAYFHLDSNHVMLSQGRVSRMEDQTANNRNGTFTDTNHQGIYILSDPDFNNNPSVEIPSAIEDRDQMSVSNFGESSGIFTFLMVTKGITGFTHNYIDNTVPSSNGLFLEGSTGDYRFGLNGTLNALRGGLGDKDLHVIVGLHNLNYSRLWVDGQVVIAGRIQLGQIRLESFIMKIGFKFARVILYNRKLTIGEINTTARSMASQYGSTWTDICEPG